MNPFTDVSMVPEWSFYNPLQDQVNDLIESTMTSSDSTVWTYLDLVEMDVLQVPFATIFFMNNLEHLKKSRR